MYVASRSAVTADDPNDGDDDGLIVLSFVRKEVEGPDDEGKVVGAPILFFFVFGNYLDRKQENFSKDLFTKVLLYSYRDKRVLVALENDEQ